MGRGEPEKPIRKVRKSKNEVKNMYFSKHLFSSWEAREAR